MSSDTFDWTPWIGKWVVTSVAGRVVFCHDATDGWVRVTVEGAIAPSWEPTSEFAIPVFEVDEGGDRIKPEPQMEEKCSIPSIDAGGAVLFTNCVFSNSPMTVVEKAPEPEPLKWEDCIGKRVRVNYRDGASFSAVVLDHDPARALVWLYRADHYVGTHSTTANTISAILPDDETRPIVQFRKKAEQVDDLEINLAWWKKECASVTAKLVENRNELIFARARVGDMKNRILEMEGENGKLREQIARYEAAAAFIIDVTASGTPIRNALYRIPCAFDIARIHELLQEAGDKI